jgi:hypothetical protein
VRAGDRLRLRAAVAAEFGPDAGKSKQRSIVVEREPDDVRLLGLRVWLRAYSEKLLAGTRHRFIARQLGLGHISEDGCHRFGELAAPRPSLIDVAHE